MKGYAKVNQIGMPLAVPAEAWPRTETGVHFWNGQGLTRCRSAIRVATMSRNKVRNLHEQNSAMRDLIAAGHTAAEARAILIAIADGFKPSLATLPSKTEMRDEFATVSRIIANHVAARDRILAHWLIASHLLLLAIIVGMARFTDIL